MTVGPLPQAIAVSLLAKLEAKFGQDETQFDVIPFSAPAEVLVTSHPQYRQEGELVMMELSDEAVEHLRRELESLGVLESTEHGMVSDGKELEAEDLLCPQCGETTADSSMCKVHGLRLVTFERYAELKRAKSEAGSKTLIWVLLALAAFVAVGWYLSKP